MLRALAALALSITLALAQRSTGELRLSVVDSTGAALSARGTLTAVSTQVRRDFSTDDEGRYIARDLPFGSYRLELRRAGFTTYTTIITIGSALPAERRATMAVAAIGAEVLVTDAATMVDPRRTGPVQYVGGDTLRDRVKSAPGRSVVDLVNSQPGWLLEANGVLHPRGSEYETQYVVDGIPLTDNRSPSFAPEIDADELQSLSVLTGNYPAEYGRKLGGVVEVTTRRDERPGLHGRAGASAGAFGTVAGSFGGQYGWGRNAIGFAADAGRTDRYLDAPTLDNFSNSGTAASASGRFERDFSPGDRLRMSLARRQSRFLVPNERLQETAGQRQDRTATETAAQVSYQHIFSPNVLANVRGMIRDLEAELWSNALSTPIAASQDRGFREGYMNAAVSVHAGDHEWKAGGEANFANLFEDFGYDITAYRVNEVRIFDRDTPQRFRFSDRGRAREQSAFVQDLYHRGRLTVSAGLRWDHYRLLVDEQAVSPRLGAAWHVPQAALVLRGSYDRIFQTPAIENLLLSSSEAVRQLGDESELLPVRPSRGHFVEVGFSKSVGRLLRVDGQFFRRSLDNFADDDLLLNTGVTFPVTFSSAVVQGFETKVEVPRWGPFSGYAAWSNLVGKARLPVTGGLFLGDEAIELIESAGRIPITQDQRNTVSAKVRADAGRRIWLAATVTYGSGLPLEAEDLNLTLVEQQYGRAILERVNFERERTGPVFSMDASAAVRLIANERWSARVQADAFNLTDRLNVINFAGLFSGTALGRPRSASVRLQVEF
jgi:outer membrane cobalamin receptor